MLHEKGPGLAKCGRVGGSMLLALQYVAEHPGCTKYAAARHLAGLKTLPRARAKGPASYYDSVDACLRWGLLLSELDSDRRNCGVGPGVYSLTLTPDGERALAEKAR
jgi:hypothetical protein